MTTIQTNKLGLDVVDIEVECTGVPQTDMFFQEPVLDHERDYVLGVSEISVPLAGENLITNDPILLQESLLQLKRKRSTGANSQYLPRGNQGTVVQSSVAHFKLSERLVSSPADLVYHLTNYIYGIQVYLNSLRSTINGVANQGDSLRGDNPDYKIDLISTPSGVLRLRANPHFWIDYCFEISDFGRELLGYYDNHSLVGIAKPTGQALTYTNLTTGGNNTFVASDEAEFLETTMIPFVNSMFRYVENRLRLEVDADLAIPSNILVENGEHKLHYNIASFAIPHTFMASGTIDHNPVVNAGVLHESHLYVGNVIIKSKETPTTDWYKLMSAANVQNMRLHLIMVRRVWDRDKKTWRLTRDKLIIHKDATWFVTLKFVEQF